jgi:hypothetical protein
MPADIASHLETDIVYFGQANALKNKIPAAVNDIRNAFNSGIAANMSKGEAHVPLSTAYCELIGSLTGSKVNLDKLTPAQQLLREEIMRYQAWYDTVGEVLSMYDTKEQLTKHQDRLELFTDLATINQSLNQELLMIWTNENMIDYKRAFSHLFAVADAFRDDGCLLGRYMSDILNQSVGQAAYMKYFHRQGFTCYAPDPKNRDEVMTWDVLSNVDFIAIKGNTVFFIDSKGSVNYPSGIQTISLEDQCQYKNAKELMNNRKDIFKSIQVINSGITSNVSMYNVMVNLNPIDGNILTGKGDILTDMMHSINAIQRMTPQVVLEGNTLHYQYQGHSYAI